MWEAGTEGSLRLLKRSLAEYPLFTSPTSKFHRIGGHMFASPRGREWLALRPRGKGCLTRVPYMWGSFVLCSRHQVDAMHYALK